MRCGPMRWWHLLFVVVLFGSLVGCDHTTKHLAVTHLRDAAPTPIVPGMVELSYTENRDMAFSLLGGLTTPATRYPFLVAAKLLGVLVAAGLLVTRWRRSGWLEKAGLTMLMAGALGNLIDRVVRGFVVDFIHVTYWPVFNVADVAICVGVAMLLWAGYRSPGRRASPSDPRNGTSR